MRILIVPTSRNGGTAEIGRAIARRLRSADIDVDVAQPGYAGSLSRYDGFIVGSAIYEGAWMPAAIQFVQQFATELRKSPLWLFSSGLTLASHASTGLPESVVRRLECLTNAAGHEEFGGRLRLDDLEPTERAIAAWVGLIDMDERNWSHIDEWVDTIIESLTADGADCCPMECAGNEV